MGRELLVSGCLWLGCGMHSWPSLAWLVPCVFLSLGFGLGYLLTYEGGPRTKGFTS